MKQFFILFLILGLFSCKQANEDVEVESSSLLELFRYSNPNIPEISVHRGGKGLEYFPENCLETIKYVNDSINAIFEVDVAQTKDGELVLMHDNSINRTTTGEGLLRKLTYKELSNFNLVDDYGNKTNFKVPLFLNVLKWCKSNNVVLSVDIKRSVNLSTVINVIRATNAEDNCILITYDMEQANSAYKLAPELLLSVSARNMVEWERLLASNIPTQNMMAFTGTRLSDASLFEAIHEKDVLCILGTLGNLDRQAQVRGDDLYRKWKSLGADVLATDRPFEAFTTINEMKRP